MRPTECPVEFRWKRQFAAELSRYGDLMIYVDPITRKLHYRQTTLMRKAKKLPVGAVLVGHYVSPTPVANFLADMHATMALFTPASPAQ